MNGQFILEVAGVRICIEAPVEWLPGLEERYAAFLSGEPASWRLTLLADSTVPSSLPGEIAHEGPYTRFHVGTYRGHVDLDGHAAAVTAATEAHAAPAVERAAAYVLMQTLPRDCGGLWLHASGIVRGGRGYVFFGKSGSGKTTIASLAPPDADVLCDENVVLTVRAGEVTLHSTPFWGHSTPPHLIHRHNASVPLAGLFALAHGPYFRLDTLSPAEAVTALLDTEKVATERVASALAWLGTAEQIVARVPVRRLTFRPEPSLWDFLASQGT